jgi:hypothetical protein
MLPMPVLPLLAWLLPLCGALGSRVAIWPWWIGFAICLGGALCSLWLLLRLPWHPRRAVALLGALPLVLPAWFLVKALQAHPINDVSTDPLDPPTLRWASQARSAADLPINPAPLKFFPDNPAPLYTRANRSQVLAEACGLMTELGWQHSVSGQGLEAVVVSPWFGFRDDVALRLFEGPKELRIDMRSASRQGRSDLGANRARIQDFLTRLHGRLAKAQGTTSEP